MSILHEHRFRAMNTEVAAWLWSSSPWAGQRLPELEVDPANPQLILTVRGTGYRLATAEELLSHG